ncbi:hypothetical protein LX36DRAFT_167643 [Colletotrichum falcatum]|nr:hypothetical protein LX36DRAFT_167643 [Colletotrichum falcatum]
MPTSRALPDSPGQVCLASAAGGSRARQAWVLNLAGPRSQPGLHSHRPGGQGACTVPQWAAERTGQDRTPPSVCPGWLLLACTNICIRICMCVCVCVCGDAGGARSPFMHARWKVGYRSESRALVERATFPDRPLHATAELDFSLEGRADAVGLGGKAVCQGG